MATKLYKSKNMFIRILTIILLLSTVTITSCVTDDNGNVKKTKAEIAKDKAIKQENKELGILVDKDKVVSDTRKSAENISKFSPEVIDFDDIEGLRKSKRMITRDGSTNRATVNDNNESKVFNIDLNVENVNIRTFMHMLSEITGVNFLVSDEVTGVVSAKLVDVPWTSALDSVLNLKNLAQHVDNKANIIRIHSQTAIVKLENFERQRNEDLQKIALLEKSSEPLYTEIFKLFYTKPDKVKTIIESVLGNSKDPASAGTQITIDERMNQLIIKARKDDMDTIGKVISNIDTRTKQVFIEAFIVEVQDNFRDALGVKLKTNLSSNIKGKGTDYNVAATGITGTGGDTLVDLAANGATSGIGFTFGRAGSEALKLQLTALESQGYSKTISNPRIFTLDNQKALIFQGTEVPYETSSANNGTSVQFKEAGLRLEVTPTVVGDGNLLMSIKVNNDTVDTTSKNPPITKSEVNTNLVTKDGSIVVIGGIYVLDKNDAQNKVPLFGDIPVAGNLFKNSVKKDNKKELMIFMAPKII